MARWAGPQRDFNHPAGTPPDAVKRAVGRALPLGPGQPRKAEKEKTKRMADNPYDERRASLAALGFASYELYLQSRLWASIRSRVLLPSTQCVRCVEHRATAVHHASYDIETMAGRRTDALLPACRRCHHLAERRGRHEISAADRLAAATLFLLAGTVAVHGRGAGHCRRLSAPGAPRRGWEKWVQVDQAKARRIRTWTVRQQAWKSFSASPRLVKKAV